MKNVWKKVKNKWNYLGAAVLSFWIMRMDVFANSGKPIFVTGTERLVEDLTKWLMGGAAVVTGLLLMKTGYQWNISDTDERPRHKKKFFMTLVIGAGIVLATPIVTWFFSYYIG